MIPGANLLSMALTIIQPATVQYYAFISRALNAAGVYITTFDAPVPIQGSLQPIPRSLYADMGLDFNRNYAMLYADTPVGDVTRNRTGDQIGFDGRRWQVESANDWQAVDGWSGVLCVEVPAP
jgi:hypothetical protein